MHIATYSVRSVSLEDKIIELEEELSYRKWDILGLSGIRRGENQLVLKSGHLVHYNRENNTTTGGVGLIVYKKV